MIFIALGFYKGDGSTSHLVEAAGPAAGGAAARADSGDVHLLGLERRRLRGRRDPQSRPQRAACPRACMLSAVVAIYFLLNLLFLYVLPVNQLAQVKGSVLDVIAERLLGVRAGDIMIVSIISIAASISAMTFAGPRRALRDGADGLPFRAARVHLRHQTPATSIVAQAVWAGLLVPSGERRRAHDLYRPAVVLFASFYVTSLFVLRQREPDAARPFRAWGIPSPLRSSRWQPWPSS